MSIEIAVIAILAAAAAGWLLRGLRSSPDRSDGVVRQIAQDLGAGRLPEVPPGGPAEAVEAVRAAVEGQWSLRNEDREQALRVALGRIAAFLREGVRDPLNEALEAGPEKHEAAIQTAVGAIRDLEFFLRDPITPDETHNLGPVVQQVAREFALDWNVTVRLRQSPTPVRAHIHRPTFMDAIYLLLHNAAQFAGAGTVDVTVADRDGEAIVEIRDRGPGFSEEALVHAHDLFYTTTDSALGLGIPFARKIVESVGGALEIENVPEGGALVRLSIPAA